MRITDLSSCLALSLAMGLSGIAPPALGHSIGAVADMDTLPMLADVAPEAIAISPHVPQMGIHYALPADLPTGPIWCVIEGRVVCVEYMFPAAALADGESWTGLLPGGVFPPITHVDFEYKPDGVGPISEPIYQLHIWFAEPAVLAAY
ncbi:MAG: hypothetical protein JJU19_11145 [Pararhodobacter sp.]|nr:hypothetical protein [Pararhodobacter sp.]